MKSLKAKPFPITRALLVMLLAACPAFAQQENSPSFTELTVLARGLRSSKSLNAYAALKRFAQEHTGQPAGARAALALGHFDSTSNRAGAAAAWLEWATQDPLLADYAQFWLAQTERAQGKPAAALARLEELRAKSPGSALAGETLEALAHAALLTGQPEKTIALLADARTDSRPDLLFLRAQALQRAGNLARAAVDYSAVYYRFPLSPEARLATAPLAGLRQRMRAEFPAIAPTLPSARVQGFLDDKRCSEARRELGRLGLLLPSEARDQLRVRVAACMKRGSPNPAALETLKVAGADANAERLYLLSQAWRSKRNEHRMLAAVEEVALRHPSSPWSDRALFAAGNYFWTQLDHARAALYYQRLLEAFPSSENGVAAHWRVAWQAYLEDSPRAAARALALMEEHLLRFRGSPYAANALYWRARLAERKEQPSDARALYVKLIQRFPQSYFAQVSAQRLRELGAGETAEPEILSAIPPAHPPVSLTAGLTAEAQQGRARAQALRSIDLDAYAEKELLAAYEETRAPELLLDAAQIAHDDSRFYKGIILGRRLVPQLESRRLPDLPEEVWRAVYPFVYGDGIQATAAMAGLDPMLVAGLIRQESVFQAGAVSRAGACGLMQVMPRTGKQLARQLRLSYAKKKLFQPEFNLRLGTTHLARLVREFGSVEAALAAYNAGENRVYSWQAGRTYREPAEFVETIPFTETREYVQIVLRNREIYRSLYGHAASASAAAAPLSQ